MIKQRLDLLFLLLVLSLVTRPGFSQEKNDFDLSTSLIPVDEIHHGDQPRFAFPIGTLTWHEIVNHEVLGLAEVRGESSALP